MKKKRVAVIGAGISGLSALHELAKISDIDAHLYESSQRVGGRIYTSNAGGERIELGASYFHGYYYSLRELIKEFGLGERLKSYEAKKTGFLLNDGIVTLDNKGIILSLLSGKLYPKDVVSLFKLKRKAKAQAVEGYTALEYYWYFNDLEFMDILEWFPLTKKGYSKSFRGFFYSLGKRIREYFVRPFVVSTLCAEPEEINEAVGKAVFIPTVTDIYTLEEGMDSLPKKIYEAYRDRISLETPVEKIEFLDGKYGIATPMGEEEFDFVISAVPLPKLAEIFKDVKDQCKIKYGSSMEAVVRGNLKNKYKKVDSLFIGEGNSGITHISKKGKNLYKVSAYTKNPQFEDFFTDYEIVESVEWKHALPVVSTLEQIPRMVDERFDRFYKVGDFSLPCMEMSSITGRKAALDIAKRF